MDTTKKWRFRFGLRGLLGGVTLIGAGLYFWPAQVDPANVPNGATKAWVFWNCGPPINDYYADDQWEYAKRNPGHVRPSHWNWIVYFDENTGRVTEVAITVAGGWERP